jgi:hypothetical protein
VRGDRCKLGVRSPQLPVDEVKDIYNLVGLGKVNKPSSPSSPSSRSAIVKDLWKLYGAAGEDTTTMAAARLSIGCWVVLYAALIVTVVIQCSAGQYVGERKVIAVGIIQQGVACG